MHDPDPLEEFDDDPIGSMRKAAAYFEQNPVTYTHPISKKAVTTQVTHVNCQNSPFCLSLIA